MILRDINNPVPNTRQPIGICYLARVSSARSFIFEKTQKYNIMHGIELEHLKVFLFDSWSINNEKIVLGAVECAGDRGNTTYTSEAYISLNFNLRSPSEKLIL